MDRAPIWIAVSVAGHGGIVVALLAFASSNQSVDTDANEPSAAATSSGQSRSTDIVMSVSLQDADEDSSKEAKKNATRRPVIKRAAPRSGHRVEASKENPKRATKISASPRAGSDARSAPLRPSAGDANAPTSRNVVPHHSLAALRIRGTTQISPPAKVRLAIARKGNPETVAVVKMCLTKNGKVANLEKIRSSGYPAYDQLILSQMRRWRYRPFVINAKPAAVCTVVRFVYRQKG